MEKRKTKPGARFWILLALTALVFAALLELNKNTLPAWAAALLLLVFVVLLRRRLFAGGFGRRLLG